MKDIILDLCEHIAEFLLFLFCVFCVGCMTYYNLEVNFDYRDGCYDGKVLNIYDKQFRCEIVK